MKHTRGFTLLEMIVAIAIFAGLSLASYQLLMGVLNSDRQAETHANTLRQMQRAMLIMQRDFSQITARGFRREDSENASLFYAQPYAFESESLGIEFVALGWRNPQNMLPRSQLQRVRYYIRDKQLFKAFFLYPDASIGATPRELMLLDGVESLSLRYFTSGKWVSEFETTKQLPKGIELTLTLSNFGEVRRVFMLGEDALLSAPEHAQEKKNVPTT